jgi:phage tail tape-measure protein
MKTSSTPATPSTTHPGSTALGPDGKPLDLKLPTHHDHALAEAGALGGAIAGGVIGAIAGPVGAIAGAAIGSAIGGFAGNTIDHEQERTSLHDKELDEAIGVSNGHLGTPPETKHPSAEVLAEARENDRLRSR